jgi:membrane protein
VGTERFIPRLSLPDGILHTYPDPVETIASGYRFAFAKQIYRHFICYRTGRRAADGKTGSYSRIMETYFLPFASSRSRDQPWWRVNPSSEVSRQQTGIYPFFQVFFQAYQTLSRKDPLRLGAATAFFTIFSLPAILIIVINGLGFLFNEAIISGRLFNKLAEVVGPDATDQIKLIFDNLQSLAYNLFYTFAGVFFILFVATTLFIVVQRSINEIWNVQVTANKWGITHLRHRLVSVMLILMSGGLVVVALLSDVLLYFAWQWLEKNSDYVNLSAIRLLNRAVTLTIITVWFAVIFRYLPDARISWKGIWVGAVLTSVLFQGGVFVLGELLVGSELDTIYGAAGSIILLLLFIFYSSFILYYGASFTKAYADYAGLECRVKHYAAEYQIHPVAR